MIDPFERLRDGLDGGSEEIAKYINGILHDAIIVLAVQIKVLEKTVIGDGQEHNLNANRDRVRQEQEGVRKQLRNLELVQGEIADKAAANRAHRYGGGDLDEGEDEY